MIYECPNGEPPAVPYRSNWKTSILSQNLVSNGSPIPVLFHRGRTAIQPGRSGLSEFAFGVNHRCFWDVQSVEEELLSHRSNAVREKKRRYAPVCPWSGPVKCRFQAVFSNLQCDARPDAARPSRVHRLPNQRSLNREYCQTSAWSH